MESRYISNPFTDLQRGEIMGEGGKLLMPASDGIRNIYMKLLGIFQKKLPELMNSKDASIYTGTSGLAYLYLQLFEKEGDPEFLQEANLLAGKAVQKIRQRDVTFLCGDIGPLCVAAAVKQKLGETTLANNYLGHVLDFLPAVLDSKSGMQNELLYGRVGYLYGLLYLNKYVAPIKGAIFQQVAEAIISDGKQRQGAMPPLMWEWHGKEYLGAAHGVAGILYLLLQMNKHLSEENLKLVKQTVDFLLSIRFKSGNLPSSVGSTDDKLVHWCHGAPGFVQLLLASAHVWNEKCYLDAAVLCGEVVWERGILKKGYSICHGVAGNAYTFIALYQATRKAFHLKRALHFARWCETYPDQQERRPDRPYSLFEGLAGIIFFLQDIQHPLAALFPGYSIDTFHVLEF